MITLSFILLCRNEFHQTYSVSSQEPYKVIVCAEALVVMDIVSMTKCWFPDWHFPSFRVLCYTNNRILSQHAHVSMGEVIGLLGGTYEEEEKVLKVS